jgi:hypothetical protein
MTTGTEVSDAFTLLSLREKHRQEAIALTQTLKGKSLYLSHLTRIFDMGLTTKSIQTIKAGLGYSDAQIFDAPLLTPLSVVETRYDGPLDYTVVILQLPNERKAQYVLGCVVDQLTRKNYNCAATSLPSFLTAREVGAIRKGSIFIGMSETALYMAMGFPKETNEAVVGSTQLIYHTCYVYLNRDKKVEEIQDHN